MFRKPHWLWIYSNCCISITNQYDIICTSVHSTCLLHSLSLHVSVLHEITTALMSIQLGCITRKGPYSNALSRCHTKTRMDARGCAHPSVSMTTFGGKIFFKKNNLTLTVLKILEKICENYGFSCCEIN